MSINVNAVLYINCKTNQQSKRLQVYLSEDTRPDFPEDTPPEEAKWVEPFEFLENPNGIKTLDDKSLLVKFYPEETDFTDDAKELIKTLLEIVEVESIIYCELGEDWTIFEYFTKEKRQLLWAVEGLDDPDDDEKYNQFLSEKEKEALQTVLYGEDESQAVEDVLLQLSNKLLL